MKNKVMDVYDKYYDETFSQILSKVNNREKAKELIGRIFSDTASDLSRLKNKNIEVSKTIFEKNKEKYGVC
jgi:hypothetical protein